MVQQVADISGYGHLWAAGVSRAPAALGKGGALAAWRFDRGGHGRRLARRAGRAWAGVAWGAAWRRRAFQRKGFLQGEVNLEEAGSTAGIADNACGTIVGA